MGENKMIKAKQQIYDKIIDILHEIFGVCSCCGKRLCEGRKENSTLPNKLPTSETLEIIFQAFEGDDK